MSNIENVLKIANSLAKFAEANEKISLPLLNIKLARANSAYPEDQTIGVMRGIIGKMSSKQMEISKSELKDLYNKLYQRNTKFAQIFSDELGIQEEFPLKTEEAPKEEYKPLDMDSIRDEMIDPVFAAALDNAMGGNRKPFNSNLAKQAVASVQSQFDFMGFAPKCSIAAGKGNIFVCNASFESPRGTTSMLVPAFVNENKMIAADKFVGAGCLEDFTRANVTYYLNNNAGGKLTVNANEVLDVLNASLNNEISEVDLAFIKMSQVSEQEYLSPSIMGQEIDAVNPDLVINLPENKDPEFASLSRQFETALGSACFTHGSKAVQSGRDNIEKSLRDWGIRTASTVVAESDDGSITYSVSINGGASGFRVPVSIYNKAALMPEIILCNGSIREFSKEGLSEVVSTGGYDKRAIAIASPLYGNKPSELVRIIRQATAENNFAKAEDALNTLSQSGDDKAYAAGMSAFTSGLRQEKEEVAKCAKVVRHNHSSHAYCGHTNMPLHKTFVDKRGMCQPLHRQASEDSSDGSSEMDKLIFRGNR